MTLKFGITVRSMGPESTPALLRSATLTAEEAGLDSIWITDHVAIPPDDAEGSGGRYLDPLTTLAWMAAQTRRIHVGSGVLILPYREPLPTAKAVATVQELADGRLELGVGVGWMEPEFRALGVPREERGRRTDETLEFLHTCFAEDIVERNGQPFLFRPRPPRPRIHVGGDGDHAWKRTVHHGDAWMPMVRNPARLSKGVEGLRRYAEELEKPLPGVTAFAGLALGDATGSLDHARALVEAGADHLVVAVRYRTYTEYVGQVRAVRRLADQFRDS